MRGQDEIMEEIADIEMDFYCEGRPDFLSPCEFEKVSALRWVLDRHCDEELIRDKCILKVLEQHVTLKPEYKESSK